MTGRPWPDSKLSPCGTPGAVRRHYRNREPLDDACRTAQSTAKGSDPWRSAPFETPDFRPVRNGIPWKPYVYRGLGYDQMEGPQPC